MEKAKAVAALIGWTVTCMAFPPVAALLAGDGGMKKVLIWGGTLLVWALLGPIVSVLAGIYAVASRAPTLKRAGAKDRQRRFERERSKCERSKREQEDWDQHIWDGHVMKADKRADRDASLLRPRRDMPPAWRR